MVLAVTEVSVPKFSEACCTSMSSRSAWLSQNWACWPTTVWLNRQTLIKSAINCKYCDFIRFFAFNYSSQINVDSVIYGALSNWYWNSKPNPDDKFSKLNEDIDLEKKDTWNSILPRRASRHTTCLILFKHQRSPVSLWIRLSFNKRTDPALPFGVQNSSETSSMSLEVRKNLYSFSKTITQTSMGPLGPGDIESPALFVLSSHQLLDGNTKQKRRPTPPIHLGYFPLRTKWMRH